MDRDSPTKRRDEREKPGGFFDRPLWRIIIPIVIVSFAVQRGAAAFIYSAGGGSGLAVAGYVLQAVIALAVAVAIFIGRPRIFSSSD